MKLQLALKKKWFEMTKAGVKIEDYREITPYWCARLLQYYGENLPAKFWKVYLEVMVNIGYDTNFKPFKTNKMTLGYPKATDSERIVTFEHKGITIGEGKPEWGAVPGKFYFIIKHGERLHN